MSHATLTRGDAPVLLDRDPRKRVQEIRKDIDETLDRFPAVLGYFVPALGGPEIMGRGTRRHPS
eukprot:9499021-Pyramimonas_sp.AAC.1